MQLSIKSLAAPVVVAVSVLLVSPSLWARDVIPASSPMAQPGEDQYLSLLSPLHTTRGIRVGAWRVRGMSASTVTEPEPRVAGSALRFTGDAQASGAKGDVNVFGSPNGSLQRIGYWAHFSDQANVARLGVQLYDADGEAFLLTTDAPGTGWHWVEFDLTQDDPPHAYRQDDGNGVIDQPLNSINIAWFVRSSGQTELTVNALAALSDEPGAQTRRLIMPAHVEPNRSPATHLLLHNRGDAPVTYEMDLTLQRDAQLPELQLPDPVHGSDHAKGAKSWTEHKGQEVSRGTLTDEQRGTSFRLPWGSGYTELVQYVELDETRTIEHMTYDAGDANWAWQLDVSYSTDGKSWQPVPGLTGHTLQGRWGKQTLPVREPFAAKHLRLRYHNNGEASNTINTMTRLQVYDGASDETWTLPDVGETVATDRASVTVPARRFAMVRVFEQEALGTGAYLLAARLKQADRTAMLAERVFVMPDPVSPEFQKRARVGLNSSQSHYAPIHERLGIGWVRFENLKWRMASPAPDTFDFRGIHPWFVDHDAWLQEVRASNIEVLPYLFLSPEWASSAPQDAKHRAAWPPTNYEDYGDFVFQAVARYGSVTHPSDVLKTEDKKSGMDLLTVVELWNEPNLDAPSWGHWIGPLNEYYKMFRIGAEAAKRADPDMRVANGGFAGIGLGLVDQLRTYEYDDGQSPLDFVDVLSVHTYTGAVAPENARIDTNVDRGADAKEGLSHEEQLRRLDDWRDRYRPDMPIWLTETGYDSDGPRAVSERLQAAYNVRNTLLMLAHGIDKVLIFREKGSGNHLYAASGLMRNDLSYKPSWFAIATLLRQVDRAERITKLPHDNDDVYLVGWQVDGVWKLAAWSIVDEPQTLGVELGGATVTDSFGATRSVSSTADLELGQMPIYLGDIANAQPLADRLAEKERALAEARRQQAMLSKLKAWAFDFGTTKHVGSYELGGPRPMIAIGEDVVYPGPDGYGFVGGPARRVDDAHWMSDPVTRDGVRMNPGMAFRVKLPAGRYDVVADAIPAGGQPMRYTVDTGAGRATEYTSSKDQPQTEFTVAIRGEPLTLTFESHGGIRMLKIVEAQ